MEEDIVSGNSQQAENDAHPEYSGMTQAEYYKSIGLTPTGKPKRGMSVKNKKAAEKRRMRGYREWLRRRRISIAARKKREAKKKEKEKERKRKARERAREKAKKKRPVGRPKKRGRPRKPCPKKPAVMVEKKRPGRPKLPPYTCKIISCVNGVQKKVIGRYRSLKEAYAVFKDMRKNPPEVIFPETVSGVRYRLVKRHEYLLIQQSDAEPTVMRNEYGKLVRQNLTVDGWIVVDKFPFEVEETFWVWGYHKRKERKTFLWVYENMVVNEDEADCMKSVVIFHNKIIIRNDDTDGIGMVLCKTEGDAIKFYNLTEKRVRKDKLLKKRIFFIGWCESDSPLGYKLRGQIHDLTGWKDKKITMVSNTYYASTVNILKRQKEEMRKYCEEHGIPFIDTDEESGDEGSDAMDGDNPDIYNKENPAIQP